MKTIITKFAATALLVVGTTLSLSIATTALAEVDPGIGPRVQAAAGVNSNVRVVIQGNNVTLYGYVEDENSLLRIEQIARRSGAERVINSVIKTN